MLNCSALKDAEAVTIAGGALKLFDGGVPSLLLIPRPQDTHAQGSFTMEAVYIDPTALPCPGLGEFERTFEELQTLPFLLVAFRFVASFYLRKSFLAS